MVQLSTLPAQGIHKAFIRAYTQATHVATIQLAASTQETIENVRVASNIRPAECAIDHECTVLFFDANNSQDAIVIATQGAPPAYCTSFGDAVPNAARTVGVITSTTSHPGSGIYNMVYGERTAGPQFTYGLSGGAVGQGTPSASYVYGLYFYAQHNTSSPNYQLGGILVQMQSGASGVGALSVSRGLHLSAVYWGGSQPATSMGVDIEQIGGASVATVYGLRVQAQTATNVYLIEAMSAVSAAPYFRVVGGAAPAANNTHVWVAEGVTPTLRNLRWKLYSALVAGDRVCVLV